MLGKSFCIVMKNEVSLVRCAYQPAGSFSGSVKYESDNLLVLSTPLLFAYKYATVINAISTNANKVMINLVFFITIISRVLIFILNTPLPFWLFAFFIANKN